MRRPVLISAAIAGAATVVALATIPVEGVAPLPNLGNATPLLGKGAVRPGATVVPGGVAPMPVAPPTSGEEQGAGSKDDDTVTYDSGPAQYIDKDHRWMMTGGVSFVQGDATLQTQSALVNLDQDMKARDAKALAPVHLWNDQDDLTGTHGNIDFSSHVATITDHITLIAKPSNKPQPKGSVRGQFKDPATITCEKIVYNYRQKTGHIPGPLTIRQKDRTVTADTAEYDGNRKTVDLKGHVHGVLKDGSVIDAPEVQIGIDEGHEWLYLPSHFHGMLPTKKDQDNNDNGPTTKPTPAPPPALPPIPENPETPSTPSAAPSSTPPSTSSP